MQALLNGTECRPLCLSLTINFLFVRYSVHPSFKNTKQFIQAVADERDEDEVIERKESRGKALDVKEDGNSSEEEIDEEASALGSVTQQQVTLSVFHLKSPPPPGFIFSFVPYCLTISVHCAIGVSRV